MASDVAGQPADPPHASVVVPAYGRPDALGACVDALLRLEPPEGGYEVVVVDDGSPEPLTLAEHSVVRLVRQPNAGPAAARNHGARIARGRVLAFTDDDCRPAPDWLVRLITSLESTPGALVGGRTVNALTDNPFASASQAIIDHHYETYNRPGSDTVFFTSNNFVVSRERFQSLGGFDESFAGAAGEDRDFCDRWLAAGFPIRYVPDALVRHAHEMSAWGFVRQQFAYGRGAGRCRELRLRRGQARTTPKGESFYRMLARRAFAKPLSGVPGRVFLFALSQLASALGYWSERLGNRVAEM
ncbi:MAG: glycosyltransferase [Gemmatimonadota bacterium]